MEVERKFLVINHEGAILKATERKEIYQAYISIEPEIRLRSQDDKHFLTIKTGEGLERCEINAEIGEEEFNTAITDCKILGEISKTRYVIPEGDLVYELDIYKSIKNLMTVEVEFKSKQEAEKFIPPSWFDKELTYDKAYKNKNLALKGGK